jgi:hypothetical protein
MKLRMALCIPTDFGLGLNYEGFMTASGEFNGVGVLTFANGNRCRCHEKVSAVIYEQNLRTVGFKCKKII